MYAYVYGIVAEKEANELVIEAAGVGYQLTCSMNTVAAAPKVGEMMRVYTYLNVRQDGIDLFGFSSKDEKAMFLRLIAISGVGPRTAVGLLGSMSLHDLTLAIVMEDTAAISRAPGIGKKTAQRIVLEMKDKISQSDVQSLPPEAAAAVSASVSRNDPVSEALLALQSLGYSQGEAMRALSGVKDKSDKPDELVRLALRSMM